MCAISYRLIYLYIIFWFHLLILIFIPGDFVASANDLMFIINNLSKDQHGLCRSDVENIDRMNYNLVEKMTSEKVLACLKQVPKSDGTCAFIRLVKHCTDPFNRMDLFATQRIRQIWSAVFFLRGWNNWLRSSKEHSSKNFVSQNAYECIELNAHSLLNLIVNCRDKNEPHLFLPCLFSSQPCECFFRHARSMTSTQSTVINFTMLDFIHKAKRIQMQEQLKCKLKNDFVFPRQKFHDQTNKSMTLPSNQVICRIVRIAKQDAKKELNDLGIKHINFKPALKDQEFIFTPDEIEEETTPELVYCEEQHELIEAERILSNIGSSLDIRNFVTETGT